MPHFKDSFLFFINFSSSKIFKYIYSLIYFIFFFFFINISFRFFFIIFSPILIIPFCIFNFNK
ncbi:hypothetical protein H8356DRAFT_1672961 [Neocallimastix lanati (nom. inval.)]|nr:hypothetical protein H8356DRAFT_1672961 [Neocallimastix sp. JGI-2020a]